MAKVSEVELKSHLMVSLASLGYTAQYGSDMSPEASQPLRGSFRETILVPVLRASLARINSGVPDSAIAEAALCLTDSVFTTDAVHENRRMHELMLHGVPVSYFREGEERCARFTNSSSVTLN